jgi:hypothetical protein
MAMVIQKEGGARQGNANYVLYKLFRQDKATANLVCPSNAASVTVSTCIFYDVVTGNNSVACEGSTLNCSNTSAAANQFGVLVDPSAKTTPAFTAVAGYDKATGLGSVNVANLANAWGTANFTADTPAITASPSGTLPHGTNANFTVKVTATGTPTGDVSLIASPPGAAVVGIGPFTLSGGTVSISTNQLPGGTSYPVVAQYAGDGTFEPNTSAAVNVTVSKESSKSVISLWTFDPNSGAVTNSNATTAVYGSPYILRVDVTNASSQQCSAVAVPCPTGNVSLTNNGANLNDFPISNSANPPSNTATLNSIGLLEDQPVQLPGGTDKLVATYAGDNSYSGSTSAADSVSITPGQTATGVVASPGSGVTTNTSVTLTATIATQSSGNGPTGTVTFTAGSATLGTAQVVGTAAANLNTSAPTAAFGTAVLPHTFATAGTYTVVATYASADGNYSGSASSGANNATVVVAQGTSAANFAVTGSAATVTAGGSGNSTITVTPSAGFTGAVAITCGTTLPGVSCGALNVTVPASGNGTGTLAINVAAPSTAMTAMNLSEPQKFLTAGLTGSPNGNSGWWMLSGAAGIAAMLLFFFTGRKQLRAALGLSLVCVLSFTLGCGGSSGGGGGGGGTTATTTHLTVSATKLKTTDTLTVSAMVTGGTPTGNVQFFVDGAAAGSAVPLASGTTGSIMLTSASAPPLFNLIGTHTLSAHYLGDSTTGASASGSLNITVTGTTSLAITGTSGATAANGTVSLTIN